MAKRSLVARDHLWLRGLLWRGDLSPLGRAATPISEFGLHLKQPGLQIFGTATQSNGDKSPRHNKSPRHKSLRPHLYVETLE